MTSTHSRQEPFSTRRVFLPLLVCLAQSLRCSASATDTNEWCPEIPPEGVTVEDFCPEFSRIACEGLHRCCPTFDIENCIAEWMAHCEAGEISSIRSGQSCLDGQVARHCLDALEQNYVDCEDNENLEDACRFLWYGHAGPGESCRDVWWCEPGLGCQLNESSGVCVELPEQGEYCGDTQACQPTGLFCSYEDWICHPRPLLGESCEREDIENLCLAGACVAGTCQSHPFC